MLLMGLALSLTYVAQAVDASGLVPFSWKILAQAEGDLNKDGTANAQFWPQGTN